MEDEKGEFVHALQVAADAAKGFALFQCEECAEKIKNALIAAGYHGQMIELQATDDVSFMICLSYDDGRKSITQNGRHLGIRVDDTAFDNLHPHGLPFDVWLNDFAVPSSVVVFRIDHF